MLPAEIWTFQNRCWSVTFRFFHSHFGIWGIFGCFVPEIGNLILIIPLKSKSLRVYLHFRMNLNIIKIT
mgnify:CR=1 FL=1